MTLTDDLLNISLVGLVVLQVRGHRVTRARLVVPLVAALLWVLGIGARMGFALWVGHGGQPAVAHFSALHHVTSGAAWTSAFVLMAMAEVASRTGVVSVKARRSGAAIERGGLLRSPVAA